MHQKYSYNTKSCAPSTKKDRKFNIVTNISCEGGSETVAGRKTGSEAVMLLQGTARGWKCSSGGQWLQIVVSGYKWKQVIDIYAIGSNGFKQSQMA